MQDALGFRKISNSKDVNSTPYDNSLKNSLVASYDQLVRSDRIMITLFNHELTSTERSLVADEIKTQKGKTN